jgi:hypothetical protein
MNARAVPTMEHRRPWRVWLFLSIVAGVLVVVVGGFFFVPHCVPMNKLAQVRAGMTKEEVGKLLGPPQGFWVENQYHHQMSYWKRFCWCTVDIHLDGEDRVQGSGDYASIFHDH